MGEMQSLSLTFRTHLYTLPPMRQPNKIVCPLLFAVLFLGTLALYFLSAQRGFGWQDSGEYQYRVLANDLTWRSGIARAHPLYIVMARGWMRLFPAERAAWAVNGFSGVGLSVALLLLAEGVRRVTGDLRAGLVAALTLAFAHMAWWMGAMAEVYTWSLAFLMAELLLAIRFLERPEGRLGGLLLAALFAVNGLHASLHNFAFLDAAVWVALAAGYGGRPARRAVRLAFCAVAWMAGAAGLLALAAGALRAGQPLPAVVKSVLFGVDLYQDLALGVVPHRVQLALFNYALAALSFISPCFLFALPGIRAAGRPYRMPLLALTVLHLFFWIRYFVADQATFVLPTLGLAAFWAGIGAARLLAQGRRSVVWVTLLVGILLDICVPVILAQGAARHPKLQKRARVLPGRDEWAYWLIPWKGNETSAQAFIGAVGERLKPGDLLLADTTAAAPLLAAREAGQLPKTWDLVSPLDTLPGEAELAARLKNARVFVVSPVAGYAVEPALLAGGYRFKWAGPVYRVERVKSDE